MRVTDTIQTDMIRIWDVEAQQDAILRAAALLRDGRLVAFPTETVYGLGALACDEGAVVALYQAKARPRSKAFSVQVADMSMVSQVAAAVPETAQKLIKAFCPGPITIVLPKRKDISDVVTGGRPTVGVRIPDNQIALKLLKAVGKPLAVPSANISNHHSPLSGADVYTDMFGRLDLILDGGSCSIGRESTIVDCTSAVPTIIREGAISRDRIMRVVKDVL